MNFIVVRVVANFSYIEKIVVTENHLKHLLGKVNLTIYLLSFSLIGIQKYNFVDIKT